jgi:AP-4 complex subunit epsilon-1
MSSSGSHLSREFFDLVKSIGECRSKQEEDKIIENEMSILKNRFSEVSPKNLKELLVRSIYVEMLGHDASNFAYIHGVNLCHDKNLLSKRIGYLVSCLFLDPSNELMILLINTIQKDLKSKNILEISFGLIVVSRLANVEMVPVLAGLVLPLLKHESDMIRRRSVVAFHRLVQIGSDSITLQTVHEVMRRSLGDSDPGVMAVGLNLVFDVAELEPKSCSDLVPSLVGILKQVIDHRLPRDFDYHRMPAPWIQMRLLAILGILGKENEEASNQMYDVIQETIRRCDIGSNAGAAIVFECIKCITKIVPSHTLLEYSSLMISKFMASDNHNFRYIGVSSLSLIVAINPSYAAEHQMLVVECLEASDDTLRRKTIELLGQMANPSNVTVVVDRMISQLDQDDDEIFKSDLVQKICSLCEQYAPSNEWYLMTINQLYSRAGLQMSESVGDNLTRLVAEQDSEDPTTGNDLRVVAANEYVLWLEKYIENQESFSSGFLKLIVWMIGEFASMASLEGYTLDDIVDLLIDASKKCENHQVVGYMITSVCKVSVLASSVAKSTTADFLNELLSQSAPPDIHRRCKEFLFIFSQSPKVQRVLLPLDAACEDIQIDMRFLDGFCSEARRNGAREYSRPAINRPVTNNLVSPTVQTPATVFTGLRFEAYQPPPPVIPAPPPAIKTSGLSTPVVASNVASPASLKAHPIHSPPAAVVNAVPQLNVAGGKKWGPQGFNSAAQSVPKQPEPQQKQAPPPAHTAPSASSGRHSAPEPPKLSQEYLEKQRAAAALFSGMTGQLKPPSSVTSKGLAASRKTPSPQATSPSIPSTPAVDLLDLSSSPQGGPSSNEPKILKKDPPRKNSNMSDLLG